MELFRKFLDIMQPPCVAGALKFENAGFDILKYGTFYNILQVENDSVYIYLCPFSACTTTYHAFLYNNCYTTIVGDIGYIYCGTFIDN